jgi:dephospho-CoA kinase
VLRVGLTGGIASGKSTVSRILASLGAPVIDADRLVRQAYQPGSPTVAAIVRAFGDSVLRGDGSIDRAALASVVFADEAARRRLEAIVHPTVRQLMWDEAAEYERQGHAACIFDIPLLIETGLYRQFDRVWLVWVDRETQLSRLMERNELSRSAAEQLLAVQMPLDEKRAHAHVVFDNRGTLSALEISVRRLWEALLDEAGRK